MRLLKVLLQEVQTKDFTGIFSIYGKALEAFGGSKTLLNEAYSYG